MRDRLIARLEDRGSYPTWVLLAALAGMFTSTFPITILTMVYGGLNTGGSFGRAFAVGALLSALSLTAAALMRPTDLRTDATVPP